MLGAPEATEEGDKLEILVALVGLYKAKRWPIETGLRILTRSTNCTMRSKSLGHLQSELAKLLRSPSRASEILSRQRALTVEMIHKTIEAWKIPADLLVRPHKLERAA